MLREEQIDIRRKRAKSESLRITPLGKKRVFGEYRVVNPASGGDYVVSVRGFEVGDNACTCPDFKANTLGTCKHIEAVLDTLQSEVPPQVRTRKAAVTRPEVYLRYGEQLKLGLHLPPRCSDPLAEFARRFFDKEGHWIGGDQFDEFVAAVEKVPEQVTIFSDALDFIDRVNDRRELLQLERDLLAALDRNDRPELIRDLLRVPLYDYQLRGAIFAVGRGRAILGDDMGLGKTVQAMAAAELLARCRGISKVLVVAPASVKYQWESETRKFTDRPVQTIDGSREARLVQYGRPTFFRLVNYEQVTRDLAELNAWKPDYVILDEAQRIKNWESETSRSVKKLRSPYALVLTGTPLENKLEELYSIVEFVDDRRLGPAFQFLHEHRVLNDDGQLIGYRNLSAVREKLAPIFLRRTRDSVLGQLPERIDSTIYVELAPEQRRPYEEQKSALARLLSKPVPTDLDRKRILACITNMRMICNSTFLVDRATNVSPKLDEFAELMAEMTVEAGHKAVVFSQWELMQQKAAEVLERLGIGYERLHGQVPAPERRKRVERFKADADRRVFLSTDAGGTGLNLQAADVVIHLEVPWNPALYEQRVARVHRLGQQRPVRVIRMITRDSIEERVLDVIGQKSELFAGIFEGTTDEVAFTTGGQSVLLDLFRSALAVSPDGSEASADSSSRLLRAAVELLEVLAERPPAGQGDMIRRARAALDVLAQQNL